MTERKRKPKMIFEDGRLYEKLANELARSYCIISPCADCGGPVNSGYCCQRCGSTNPEGHRRHAAKDHR